MCNQPIHWSWPNGCMVVDFELLPNVCWFSWTCAMLNFWSSSRISLAFDHQILTSLILSDITCIMYLFYTWINVWIMWSLLNVITFVYVNHCMANVYRPAFIFFYLFTIEPFELLFAKSYYSIGLSVAKSWTVKLSFAKMMSVAIYI